MLVQCMLLDIWTARLEQEQEAPVALAEEEAHLQAEEDDPGVSAGRTADEPPASNRMTVLTEHGGLENLLPTIPWGHPQESAKVGVGPQPSRMGAFRLWMNTDISFSRQLWKPICWHLADMQWGLSHAVAGEAEHPWERQVTLAEMVDFEFATGEGRPPLRLTSHGLKPGA